MILVRRKSLRLPLAPYQQGQATLRFRHGRVHFIGVQVHAFYRIWMKAACLNLVVASM
jgi:hypothetical protein